MPSAKPDKARIKAAARARDREELPDFFTPIKEAAQLAVSDGALTQSRAANFELLLSAHPYLDFFPYNMLRAALYQATDSGCWEPVVERDLLVLLTTLFAERYDGFPLQDLVKADLPTFGDIYPQLFDTPPADFSVTGKLCDFTGPFKDRSRRQCYAQVDALGGTPSDMGWYTDCLFVADDHFHKRAISSGLEAAVFTRMRQGTLRIYRESAFPNCPAATSE